MASIIDLLRYKDSLELKNEKGDPIVTVWIRVLGDESIKEAYKFARIASSKRRAALKDVNSAEYADEIESASEQSKQDLLELIMAAKENEFTRESIVVVTREELPKLEDVVGENDPDAPSLEDQENLDVEEHAVENRFQKGITEYVDTKKAELQAQLDEMSDEEILILAKEQLQNILPLQTFVEELNNQKGYRGTFQDKACNIKAFETIEEFKEAPPYIKTQILNKYNEIEMGPDEIKN